MKFLRCVRCGRRLCRPPRGGRGLKYAATDVPLVHAESPPSRGAWIEIDNGDTKSLYWAVAPLAGGVD